jgi:hypothetical protein
MQQLEISFFYPLTEQVPLDLDFSNCEKPKLHTTVATLSGFYISDNSTYSTQIVGNFQIDADKTTFKTSKKPNIIRKALFNIMGIKLENNP